MEGSPLLLVSRVKRLHAAWLSLGSWQLLTSWKSIIAQTHIQRVSEGWAGCRRAGRWESHTPWVLDPEACVGVTQDQCFHMSVFP